MRDSFPGVFPLQNKEAICAVEEEQVSLFRMKHKGKCKGRLFIMYLMPTCNSAKSPTWDETIPFSPLPGIFSI